MSSIFTDKSTIPSTNELENALGSTFHYWQNLADFTLNLYPKAVMEWNYPGAKYGWSFRIKDKKRAILYLLPRERYFEVAFVFGGKACAQIGQTAISEKIKTDLASARVYAEGRGIRIEVKNEDQIADIQKLIAIKLKN